MFTKILSKFALVTIVTIPVITLNSQKVLAQEYFGAISFSQSTRANGYSYDYKTKEAAQTAANRQCESYSGAGDCKSVIWFKNACGALATDPNGAYGSGWSANRSEAESIALNSCGQYSNQCKVVRWACTTR